MNIPPLPPLGNDTVSFVTFTDTGAPVNTLGESTTEPTTVDVTQCRHRALSASETPVGLTDIGTQVWQTHAPPDAALLGAKLEDTLTGQLVCNEVTYQILGGLTIFTDDDGAPYFVKCLSKVERG